MNNLNFPHRILSIQPHPDDTEAYCSGTLKLLKERGFEIFIATYTPGDLGGIGMSREETAAVRKGEAKAAAKVLDADYYCFDCKDGFIFDSEEIRLRTISYLRRVKPGIIITPSYYDYHPDHRTTPRIVEAACLLSTLPNVPCDEEPLEITPLLYHNALLRNRDLMGDEINPHFYINIEETIDVKMQMLAYHKSQIEVMRVMHKMDDFFEEAKRLNSELGKAAGIRYAEAFWQHLGGGFQINPIIQETLSDYLVDGEG